MDRIKMAHGLTAIIDHLTEPVAEGSAGHLSARLRRGEVLPDLGLIQRLMGRLVMARLQVLVDVDDSYRDFASDAEARIDGMADALMELDDALELLDFVDPDLGLEE